MDAVYDIGVNDIFEVKFFENRANGQSKGFCVITLGSEGSVRSVMDKLGKRYGIEAKHWFSFAFNSLKNMI